MFLTTRRWKLTIFSSFYLSKVMDTLLGKRVSPDWQSAERDVIVRRGHGGSRGRRDGRRCVAQSVSNKKMSYSLWP